MNRSEPLTPEERALARLLGRTAPSAPSAALDEAVLAAARAAVQPQPTLQGVTASAVRDASPAPNAPRRPRSRLPAALGLAASVVFAVGIAWQLKPEPPQRPALMEAAPPASVPAPAEDGADAAAASAEAVAADSTTAAVPAPVAARSSAAAAQKAAPAMPAPAARAPREQTAAAPAQAAPMLTPPMPAAPPAPVAAAPPAAERYAMDVAEPRAADSGGGSGERARLNAAQVRSAPAPAPAAADAARSAGATGVMRRAAPLASGALSASAVDAAVAADAALPRKQWLKRIRERRDAGDLDTARASLEHYLQQYPEARVPRDIRQLLDN